MAIGTDINVDQLQQVLDSLLVKRLREQREGLMEGITATVSHELDEMKGEIHDFKIENDGLKNACPSWR